MNIKIIKDSLFNAPKGSIIAHACNCQGVWGSGIAKVFAERFPKEREEYSAVCYERGTSLAGSALLIPAGDRTIGCLFTSRGYGATKDSVGQILEFTYDAIADLIAKNVDKKPIAMCKINAGLFAVPWEDTLEVLRSFDQEFTIYEI